MTPYYQDAYVTLYCADCAEVLPDLPRHDLLLTDPPYGINVSNIDAHRGKKTGFDGKRVEVKDYGAFTWDQKPADQRLIDACIRQCKRAIVFGGNHYALPPSSCWLVWDKEPTSMCAPCELAWTNLKRSHGLKRHQWNGFQRKHNERRNHPTQKPLGLMSWCLEQAGDGVRTVLDPFAGSGTTLLAAKLRNQFATGIEREERYCEIIARRLQQDVLPFGQTAPAHGPTQEAFA